MPGLEEIMELAPWVIAATIALVLLLIMTKILGSRTKQSSGIGGLMMQDIDKMVKDGSMTPEEAKEVRRAMAERITVQSQTQTNSAAEAAILMQAQIDPDAVRKLLTPEALADAERKKALLRPDAQPQGSAAQAQASTQSISEPDALDPLGGLAEPDQPKPAASKDKKLDIDAMLEQGRITREEYEQMKQFFKDNE